MGLCEGFVKEGQILGSKDGTTVDAQIYRKHNNHFFYYLKKFKSFESFFDQT